MATHGVAGRHHHGALHRAILRRDHLRLIAGGAAGLSHAGNRHAGDGTIGTFNPLFPNGYYFTLAGYTGYANLIHLKPTLTVKPLDKLTIMAGVGLQWRETTADAIYIQPNVAVAGTAGTGSRWSGVYTQLRADYVFNANLTGALEAVHYKIGDTLRAAGGHDSNYLGLELKYGW